MSQYSGPDAHAVVRAAALCVIRLRRPTAPNRPNMIDEIANVVGSGTATMSGASKEKLSITTLLSGRSKASEDASISILSKPKSPGGLLIMIMRVGGMEKGGNVTTPPPAIGMPERN